MRQERFYPVKSVQAEKGIFCAGYQNLVWEEIFGLKTIISWSVTWSTIAHFVLLYVVRTKNVFSIELGQVGHD